ncbi:Asp23/Gls24 family envelope stress response protein [Cohnella fermenti]|uniref:Uncharacterized protein n=1 Tax=Cohnella fermenti TaxID=2565925 RepID=A0A4S4BJV9_9BACL|nr:hypothetical protein [Cohnella fermenti]THF74405.1 hypothetical protein E6C55_25525 [Cohnella fermenti]
MIKQDIPSTIIVNKYEFFETFTFSITASLVTLVGLITIFLSINVQHSIQKAREIYWEAIGFTYEEQDSTYFNSIRGKLRRNVELYRQILMPNFFNKIVIFIAIGSILAVVYIWWSYVYYLSTIEADGNQVNHARQYLIIVTTVLAAFCIILLMIIRPFFTGKIVKVKKIFNGNIRTELSTVSLAAHTIEILVVVDYGYLQIVPRFPFDYKNLKIETDIELYIPDAKPYPALKYISKCVLQGEMQMKYKVDGIVDLFGYDVKFNETGDINDSKYINEQCRIPDLGAGNGSEVNITLYLETKEGKLVVKFPKFIIEDIYGTINTLKPTSVQRSLDSIETFRQLRTKD